jgi:hypothetical protein
LPKHPLTVDLAEFVDEQPADRRIILAHLVCCEPCRRAALNLIQSNDSYPDLFGNPENAATALAAHHALRAAGGADASPAVAAMPNNEEGTDG